MKSGTLVEIVVDENGIGWKHKLDKNDVELIPKVIVQLELVKNHLLEIYNGTYDFHITEKEE